MTPREGGTAHSGRGPWATLSYNYTTTILLQDPRDTKGTGGHTGGSRETPEGPEGTRGTQEAPGGPEVKHGGIGAGRKATGIQHIWPYALIKNSRQEGAHATS